MGGMPQMNPLGKYASYQDLTRLEYGLLLWANPAARERLLRHWTSPSHPHYSHFAASRGFVERFLDPEQTISNSIDVCGLAATACAPPCGR
jgi:hypothetical protein